MYILSTAVVLFLISDHTGVNSATLGLGATFIQDHAF